MPKPVVDYVGYVSLQKFQKLISYKKKIQLQVEKIQWSQLLFKYLLLFFPYFCKLFLIIFEILGKFSLYCILKFQVAVSSGLVLKESLSVISL